MSLDHPREGPTAIRTNLGAIFVSLELSRSTWLVTSLSPGGGEKMSKHSVSGGDIAALLARFSELRRKACARTGRTFPIIVIQEAGLDGFWIHRVLLSEPLPASAPTTAFVLLSRAHVMIPAIPMGDARKAWPVRANIHRLGDGGWDHASSGENCGRLLLMTAA
jgi:hypothetical protein